MLPFVQILIIPPLAAISIQDFKSRSVYWFWFPLLIILFLADLKVFHGQAWVDTGRAILFNVGFIGLQLLLVSAYFSIRHKQWINITHRLLGWGDIFFLISIAFYLSPLNYIFFYVGSLIIVVLIFTSSALLTKKYELIPLAGLQSMLFIACLIASWIYPKLNLTNDDWLLHYLTP